MVLFFVGLVVIPFSVLFLLYLGIAICYKKLTLKKSVRDDKAEKENEDEENPPEEKKKADEKKKKGKGK